MQDVMPLEIFIEHETALNAKVVVEAISVTIEALTYASHELVEEIVSAVKLDETLRIELHAQIDALRDDCLWLNEIISGSTKIKGRWRNLMLAAIAGCSAHFAGSVADESPAYKDFVGIVHNADVRLEQKVRSFLSPHNRHKAPSHESGDTHFEVAFIENRIWVRVRPSKRDME